MTTIINSHNRVWSRTFWKYSNHRVSMTTTDHIVIPLPFVLGRSEREAVTSPVAKAGKSQRSGRPTCCLSNQKTRVEQGHFFSRRMVRRMVNGGFDFLLRDMLQKGWVDWRAIADAFLYSVRANGHHILNPQANICGKTSLAEKFTPWIYMIVPLHVDLGLNNSGTFCHGFSFEHIKFLLERLALEYAVNSSCLLSLLLCFHRLESPNHRVSKTSNSVTTSWTCLCYRFPR